MASFKEIVAYLGLGALGGALGYHLLSNVSKQEKPAVQESIKTEPVQYEVIISRHFFDRKAEFQPITVDDVLIETPENKVLFMARDPFNFNDGPWCPQNLSTEQLKKGIEAKVRIKLSDNYSRYGGWK